MKIKTQIVDVRTKAALEKALPEVLRVLKQGGIIIFPTDTVYGIGGNALDENVVKKIFQIKKREKQKAFLINVSSVRQLKGLVKERPRAARCLEKTFWPGPLSIVYYASAALPGRLTGAAQKIGARVPGHPVTLALLRKCGFPLVSTSANVSGYSSVSSTEELLRVFSGKAALILDAGRCPRSRPSTIVDVTVHPPRILRKGAIPAEAVYEALKISTEWGQVSNGYFSL